MAASEPDCFPPSIGLGPRSASDLLFATVGMEVATVGMDLPKGATSSFDRRIADGPGANTAINHSIVFKEN